MPSLTAKRRGTTRRGAIALCALAVATACGTSDGSTSLLPTGPTGRVRFVNLITDTTRGRVNLALEQVPWNVNQVYGTSTPATLAAPNIAVYSPILSGTRTLVLKRTADTATTVATFSLTIADNVDYTVYATGGAAASAIAAVTTTDTNTTPTLGAARVRVVHMAPTAGAVDVFVTAVGADLAAATPTLANVPVRGAAYLPSVAAGTYQVRVVPAGTAPASRAANVAINLASIAIPANGARTIIAADNNVGGAPFRFITLNDR
jgi:hypothetical protein